WRARKTTPAIDPKSRTVSHAARDGCFSARQSTAAKRPMKRTWLATSISSSAVISFRPCFWRRSSTDRAIGRTLAHWPIRTWLQVEDRAGDQEVHDQAGRVDEGRDKRRAHD